MRGTVVAVFGRRYEIETDDGERLDCVARGKKHEAACGDHVTIKGTGPGQGVIEQVLPRQSYLERADAYKRKAIAANIDQMLVLVAVEPWFSDEFVTRVLLLAQAASVPALIALNKIDLPDAETARQRLKVFRNAGHEVVEISAKGQHATGCATLLPHLAGHRTVLVGQSGMGKSSLVNALIPDARARMGEISVALGSGKHTTTFSRLYRIDADSTLIDCPGMQEVGIHNLDFAQLQAGFNEFAPFLGRCRFSNCRHDREPDCALRQALDAGRIDARRFDLFCTLREEITA
ncbi:MAG TPA: ribosome small subunit-dependent GTPase A [Burkholderiales bacterium]|jgi:ribosome biogenesis GTPase